MEIFLYIFLYLIPGLLVWEEEPVSNRIYNKLTNYTWTYPEERAYLHTDRPFYAPGETIWFKAYLMEGPYNMPDTLSSVLIVELISGEGKVTGRKLIHIREGLGYGDFELPFSLPPGRYLLKAYTRYMMNFDPEFQYRRWIEILPLSGQEPSRIKNETTGWSRQKNGTDASVKLTFFPEGGELVEGIPNYVAFKVTDPYGKGISISGEIRNSTGEVITRIQTKKFGLGYFPFKPEKGQHYYGVINPGGTDYSFPLPPAKEDGYVMHVKKNDNIIYIWILNNRQYDMENTFLIGEFRGFPFVTVHGKKGQDYIYTTLNTSGFPNGIIHFTFFTADGIPRCERLVFNENLEERMELTIEADEKKYKKRQLASFKMECNEANGKIVLTNFSVSITNPSLIPADDNDRNIKSYYYLEADLKGTIENPGYYFNPANADRHELMDILMMTHGWRRFVWKEVIEDQAPVINFPAENGFEVKGRLVDFYNPGQPQAGNIRIFIYENRIFYGETESDANGFFSFDGLDIRDSTHVVLQAWEKAGENRKKKNEDKVQQDKNISIKVSPLNFPPDRKDHWPVDFQPAYALDEYKKQNDLILKIDSAFDGRTIVLEELTIQGKSEPGGDPFERPGKLYENPQRRVVLDSIPFTQQSMLLFDLIRRYHPGITVRGAPPELQVQIRGNISLTGSTEPLILLDGVAVEDDFMYYFPTSEIAFIDVLTQSQAALYGARSTGGVIAFYTRTEATRPPEEDRKGMANFVHPGYSVAREFYAPDYRIPDEKHAKPDFRRVLYWNPSLTTDLYGNISFSFYTSDEAAEYRMEIEGMSYSGIPVTADYFFTVE